MCNMVKENTSLFAEFNVYSCGDKKASFENQNMIKCFISIFFLLFLMIVSLIIFGSDSILILCFLVPIGFILCIGAKIVYQNKKDNKIISLYFYDIDDFVQINKIPEDKTIVFISKNGTVLADLENKYEAEHFCNNFSQYLKIKEYCKNNNVV